METSLLPQMTQTSLTREQKEAIGLLSIGTFLEYMDLMLYVHMAVLLNGLFFPKTNQHAASLLTAFAFCSTFIFRPIGALLFGWLGDNIGRKATVIITTTMMAISCIIMATLPTHDQIGIAAAWIVTLCRIFQGISSVGEIVGAELYITEITKPPVQYKVVSYIAISSVIGTVVALAVASLVTSFGFNWRIAFWIGAAIAMIGALARTALRETPEFIDAKRRIKNKYEKANLNEALLEKNPIFNEEIKKRTIVYLFLINCAWPASFYFAYMHCANILKNSFSYTAEQVIHHNFLLSLIQLIGLLIVTSLSYRIYPLKILKVKLTVFLSFILFCPYLLSHVTSPIYLFLIQSIMVLFAVDTVPAVSIFFKHIPVFKRFTYSSFVYALSRALIYIITSFGIIYLTKYFGHYGLLFVMIPINIGCGIGLHHFDCLERTYKNTYKNKS